MRRSNGTHEKGKGRTGKDNNGKESSESSGSGKGLLGSETSVYHPKQESLPIYPTTSQSQIRKKRNSRIPASSRRIPARIPSTVEVTLEAITQDRDVALRPRRRRTTTGVTMTRWTLMSPERLPRVPLWFRSGNGLVVQLGIEENPMGQGPALATAGMVRLNSWHHSNSCIPRRLNKTHNNHRRLLHPP